MTDGTPTIDRAGYPLLDYDDDGVPVYKRIGESSDSPLAIFEVNYTYWKVYYDLQWHVPNAKIAGEPLEFAARFQSWWSTEQAIDMSLRMNLTLMNIGDFRDLSDILWEESHERANVDVVIGYIQRSAPISVTPLVNYEDLLTIQYGVLAPVTVSLESVT